MLGSASELWRARPRWFGETYGSDARQEPVASSGHGFSSGSRGGFRCNSSCRFSSPCSLRNWAIRLQLATLLFAAERQQSPLLVFAAAATALVTASALAVGLGSAAQQHLAVLPLKLIAGIGFMLIGAWTIFCHFR